MAQRNRAGSHVPRFGNWDPNDHAPYTKVFESARAGRGGRLINPNDPSENPEAFGAFPPPPATVAPKSPHRQEQHQHQQDNPTDPARRSRTEQRIGSREDGEFKKYMESPARYRQSPAMVGRTPSSSSDSNRRYNGSDIHRSPLHPQAKIPERNAPALPKFGDWDPKDPSSGEGFTTIFNNARNERQPGRIQQDSAPDHQQQGYGRGGGHPGRKQQSNWFCCFG
ncbi:RPM1-interacting protein 4 [Selaginella moellendorffii]|uniref:RPM1-interacting protein 4 n=1 Tax=Selaginella moellendorffii TaxID=88036 RepID=UPI000D1C3048|nr:RPM1-interacting protein 4 [Selaginella moellendorffii]|eukprot:XP_024544799.1 RPM1-interacting protein 4 [Selaginella moellendorffii]